MFLMPKNRFFIFLTTLLATLATAAVAAPGDFDTTFGKGGVLDLSEASGRRIPSPTIDQPGRAGSIAFGQQGSVYIGGGFLGASFVARILRDGTLDRAFSDDGLLVRKGFPRSSPVTDTIFVLPSGRFVTSDFIFDNCLLCPPGWGLSTRFVASFAPAGAVAARFEDGTYVPNYDGRTAVFKDGTIVFISWQSPSRGQAAITAFRSNQDRDASFERNATNAITNAAKYNIDNVSELIARVDPQDRLVIAIGGATDIYTSTGIYTSYILRLNRNGTRDTSFGKDGIVVVAGTATFDVGSGVQLWPAGIAFSPEGGVRLALWSGRYGPGARFGMAGQIRLTEAGLPDGRFTDGTIIKFATPIADSLHAIAPLANGDTILTGHLRYPQSLHPTDRILAVARMAGKTPDVSFGPAANGVVSLQRANFGLWDEARIIATSETDDSIFVMANTGAKLVKLQGAPTPTAPRYDGLWWRSPAGSESGWGVNLSHQGDILFATWFTYDLDGSGMWLVMPKGERTADGKFAGSLYRTAGSAFNQPFNPALTKTTEVGFATFDFTDANNGLFTYRVNRTTQTKPITRQEFGAMPVCTVSGRPSVQANYQGLWWNAPENSEPGWGINLTHQSDTLLATWFTYDKNGKGMWLVMSNGLRSGADAPTYSGTLYRARGPAFNADPWRTDEVSLVPVGTAYFSFANPDTATFGFLIDGFSQVKRLTRQVFAAPVSDCR